MMRTPATIDEAIEVAAIALTILGVALFVRRVIPGEGRPQTVRRFWLFIVICSAIGVCWLYAVAPPLPATTSPGAMPVYRSDMRYCFAEEIRLDGARSVLKQAESADIERFNRLVDAYNQRCGNLRESRRNIGIVEAIRSEVRANRNALWAEGIARFPAAGR